MIHTLRGYTHTHERDRESGIKDVTRRVNRRGETHIQHSHRGTPKEREREGNREKLTGRVNRIGGEVRHTHVHTERGRES